jgi:hypothetical protein
MRLSASLLSVPLLFAALTTLSTSGWAATAGQITTARTNALAYLYQSQNPDGSWGALPGVQVTATTAVIESLLSAGVSRGATYNAAISVLANAQPTSTDGLARQLDTLYHAGNDTSAQIAQLTAAANNYSSWGTLPGQGSNIADTALAMIALMDASVTYSTSSLSTAVCNVILPGQTASGGWGYLPKPVASGAPAGLATPAILPTTYAILALQKFAGRWGSNITCGSTNYVFSTVMGNGVTWLVSKQSPTDHGFGEAGTSGALETALAYRAIAVAVPGHAALAPAQDYLVGSQQANGAWSGDPLQTAMVVQSLGGAALTDSKGVGIPDTVASVIWKGGQGNARDLVTGNGQSVSGKTTASLVGVASLNQTFTGQLAAPAGSGPFTFRLLSGALPDGITLAANGSLSGTATTSGTFNFTYQVTDAQNHSTTLSGQIITDLGADVPTLPEWGAILLAAFLLGQVMLKQQRSRR